jgi:hypothetical protein
LAILNWASLLIGPKLASMTQCLALTETPPETDLARRPGLQTPLERQGFSLKPCSRIRGRERWHVDGLKGNERLAASVEVALKLKPGVEEAVANPLTGRVLVCYQPDRIQDSVETLIRRALALQPRIEQEFPRPVKFKSRAWLKRVLAAELVCSLLTLLFLGGISSPIVGFLLEVGVIGALEFAMHRFV